MRPQFPADSNPPSSRLACPAARSPLVGGERWNGGKSASPIHLLSEVSVALPLAIALLRWTAGHPPWSYPRAPDHGSAGGRLDADHHVQHHSNLIPIFVL